MGGDVTVITEAPPTPAAAPEPISFIDVEPTTSWADVATRAHALLTQTMPDEEIDALVAGAARFHPGIVLPPFLFG
jgi:hypothetical protein